MKQQWCSQGEKSRCQKPPLSFPCLETYTLLTSLTFLLLLHLRKIRQVGSADSSSSVAKILACTFWENLSMRFLRNYSWPKQLRRKPRSLRQPVLVTQNMFNIFKVLNVHTDSVLGASYLCNIWINMQIFFEELDQNICLCWDNTNFKLYLNSTNPRCPLSHCKVFAFSKWISFGFD